MNERRIAVRVGISDLNTVTAPHVIRTSGLGSCVGVVIYDLQKKIAGLAHIMLPDSNFTRQTDFNPFKYADTALPILFERLLDMDARKFAMKAKLAGGAQMFQFSSRSELMQIGSRNIVIVKAILKKYNIPIIASDVGGMHGRTIEFDPETGKLWIRTVNQGETFI